MYTDLLVECQLFLSRINEIWIFWAHIRKILKTKFHKNPSSESRVVPCGRTDTRAQTCGEANSLFSQFCERAYKRRS